MHSVTRISILMAIVLSSVAIAQQARTRPAATETPATRPALRDRDQPEERTASMLDRLLGGERAEPGRAARVEGQVVDTRSVPIEESQQEHLLVKVRTQGGQVRVVDLGSRRELAEHGQLSRGDRIIARGMMARLNDKPILLAREFARMVEIQREGVASDSPLRDGPERTWRDRGRQDEQSRGRSSGAALREQTTRW